ncbi:MAG: hypothetical protein Q4F90_09130, partial [Ruminococcus sp.]|nr:hypothetical protein [Ruminococcus sp.]
NMYYSYELKDEAPLTESVDAYEGLGKVNPNSGNEAVFAPDASAKEVNVPSPANRIDVKMTAIIAAVVVFVILVAVICIIVHNVRKKKKK